MGGTYKSIIYHPLNRARKEIRIATIAPDVDPAAPVEVSLKVVSLYESPEYTALSYCWNSLGGTEGITLCGHQTSVTKNLWEALRQFRSEISPIHMWIDALCINQDDIQERSSQVSLMREVYSRALRVRVWLGPATSQTDVGFNYLRYIMSSPPVDTNLDSIPGELGSVSDFLALGEIFRNPYWRRRWITQEIHLSRLMFIHCGRFQIGPYSAYEHHGFPRITQYTDNCQDIARRHLGERGSFYNIVLEETAAVTSALIVFVDPKRTSSSAQLNGLFRVSASADHDYVYGLLGLLPEDMGITPNYELDVKEVFADFAFRFMIHYDAMHLLYLAGHNMSDLPSWVPDLRHQVYTAPQLSIHDSNHGDVSGHRDEFKLSLLSVHARLFNASASSSCGIRNRAGEVLVIAGFLTDKIIATGEKLNVAEDGYGDLVQTFEIFAKWQGLYHRLIQQKILVDQPTCGKTDFQIAIDFLFTICAGVSQDFDDPRRTFRRCTQPDFEEYMLGVLFCNPGEYPEGVNLDHMRGRMHWLDLLAARNTFFVTASGRMGLASGDVRVGDDICILAGSPMPLRLRNVGGNGHTKYTYQSCAYVQGIMDGEAVLEAAGGNQDGVDAAFEDVYLV